MCVGCAWDTRGMRAGCARILPAITQACRAFKPTSRVILTANYVEPALSVPVPKEFISLCERTFIRMSKFFKLRIAETRKETEDCISVRFDVPEELSEIFEYKQGQYLTLRTEIRGEEVRRSYSLCSSPLDNEWRVAIKKLPGGVFSSWAHEHFKAGMEVEVMPPLGRFYCELDPHKDTSYVLFASGSGITPIMGTLKTILRQVPKARVKLFYGNKNVASIIFREELEDLKNKYLGRLSIHYILSRQDQESEWFNGRLDIDKLKHYAKIFFQPDEVEAYFICGPQPMLLALRQGLFDLGVEKSRVHVELFNSYVEHTAPRDPEEAKALEGKAARVDIKVDGKSTSFMLPYGGKTVLDGALAQGADLPYACKGGVCCTCKARLVEGEVQMEVNYGLEDDEIAMGYILTCQSHPRSEHLVVDFDQ